VLLVVAVLGLTGWRPGGMWLLSARARRQRDRRQLVPRRTAKGTYAEGGVLDILWPLSGCCSAGPPGSRAARAICASRACA
jgi:hypothetical protein